VLRDFTESADELLAWQDTLSHTHERRVWARVLGLGHQRITTVDDILDGQVTIDVTREPTRIINMRLLDPTKSLGWEPDSPSSLPVHMRRMIQVFDQRLVPGYGPVNCPMFCGPVAEADRDGAEVSVVAEGKEMLLGDFPRGHHWPKGRKVVEVIRDMLILGGEAPGRIHLPNINDRLPKDLSVRRGDSIRTRIWRLVGSVDMVCFYDGRGHFRMRRMPTAATLTLNSDLLMSQVRVDRSKVKFKNGWVVLGKNPPGDKPRISSGLIGLPKRHDFSAQSLAREGQPRWEIETAERPNCATVAKAKRIARRRRDEKVRSRSELGAETLPFPNVEEWDLYKALDPLTGRYQIRVRQATLPLVGGNQSIGAVRKVSNGGRGRGYRPPTHGGL
jgi:hypothetical protein